MSEPAGVQSDPRWAMFMTSPIPDCGAVREAVLHRSAASPDDIDGDRLERAIVDAMWERLRELTSDRADVSWSSIAPLRDVRAAGHRALAAFLSTRGAVGLALNDKLRSYLLYELPSQLGTDVDRGVFDRCDLRAARDT